jgi:hypothetical protein
MDEKQWKSTCDPDSDNLILNLVFITCFSHDIGQGVGFPHCSASCELISSWYNYIKFTGFLLCEQQMKCI